MAQTESSSTVSAELTRRIEQFRNMAQADPNNELGHFSLGKAYWEAGKFAEAAESIQRALDLNPSLSKAWQLHGDSLDKLGDKAAAVASWTRGVVVADASGDRMPRDAMASSLKQAGAPVPTMKNDSAVGKVGITEAGFGSPSGFRCSRCKKPDGNMAKAPFKGALGARIAESVCLSCWREWIPMGTKVINELGLQLSNPSSQTTYDQYMVEFLQLEE